MRFRGVHQKLSDRIRKVTFSLLQDFTHPLLFHKKKGRLKPYAQKNFLMSPHSSHKGVNKSDAQRNSWSTKIGQMAARKAELHCRFSRSFCISLTETLNCSSFRFCQVFLWFWLFIVVETCTQILVAQWETVGVNGAVLGQNRFLLFTPNEFSESHITWKRNKA